MTRRGIGRRHAILAMMCTTLGLAGSAALGQSLEFHGGQFLVIPDAPNLDITDEITLEAWALSFEHDPDGNPIVAKGDSTESYGLWFAMGAPTPEFRRPFGQINWHLPDNWRDPKANRTVGVSGSQVLPFLEWHHVAMTKTADGLRLYVDGELDAFAATEFSIIPTDEPLYVGVDFPGGHEFYSGCLDEVRIWRRALPGEEILEHFRNPRAVSGPGLVAHWTFDEGAGQTAFDSSGSGLHLQLGSTPGPDGADPQWTPHEPVTRLEIDIKPGSEPNAIHMGSRGLIPVAVLTTPEVDALEVDVQTLVFGPGSARIAHRLGHAEDVDGDGDVDLVVHFPVQDSELVCGETAAELSGRTLQGHPLRGSDSIRTVGCR